MLGVKDCLEKRRDLRHLRKSETSIRGGGVHTDWTGLFLQIKAFEKVMLSREFENGKGEPSPREDQAYALSAPAA